MLRSQAVSMFRQAAVILSTSVFAAGLLLATPGAISAATSTEKKVTALTYTTPTTKLQLRNAADTANATFSSGAGTDVAGTDSSQGARPSGGGPGLPRWQQSQPPCTGVQRRAQDVRHVLREAWHLSLARLARG